MLEPYAVKVASTVLKGLGVGNDLQLLDKYRKKLLFDNDRIEFFKEICLEIGKRYWFKFDAIGTDGDHVHIFIGAAPRYAPSNVMQIIKSITAKKTFGKYPEIKKQLWGGHFWSDGG